MKCDLCDSIAKYEAWFAVKCPLTGQRMINQLYMVCQVCARQSIAFEKQGEKAFEMVSQDEWYHQI